MSPKQFDHIENKIKQAAESFEPDFEEQSWDKMEALLNKQEKDRRRPVGWLWFTLPLLLITGVVAYLLLNDEPKQPEQSKPQYAEQKQITPLGKNNVSAKNVEKSITKDADDMPQQVALQQVTTIAKVFQPVSINSSKTKTKVYTPNIADDINSTPEKNNTPPEIIIIESNVTDNSSEETVFVSMANAKRNVLPVVAEETKTIITVDTNATLTSAKKEIKKGSTSGSSSRFYFIASGGVDAASVKLLSFSNSKSQLRYGAGIGYQLNSKLSVQTGFYAGHKKYIAGPKDYNTKEGSYLSTVDINKVDADCMIFEIPLLVRYNWLQKNKTVFYATAGLSSFIMKNEDYHYYYQYNNASYQTEREYTGNQHLFSVLNFSAGIEQKISSRFSVLAEPYIAIPLAGIGEGSVKLYSAGLQVGLKYQPFKK